MQTKISQFEELKYVVKYPDNYKEGEKFPVLIFLHGAGTRGNDIGKLYTNPFFQLIEAHTDLPFVIIAPLCQENTWFDVFEKLQLLVKDVLKLSYADNDRIYLMGASMGGYATWQLAMSMPECFAAIVPVCGGGMYWNAGRLANVPVWAFHGGKDTTVLTEESVKMVEAINRSKGNAKLTIYPENGHDSWSDTYRNPEVFAWLLKQKRNNVNHGVNGYNDSKKFG